MTKRIILVVTPLGTDVPGESLPYQIEVSEAGGQSLETISGSLLGRTGAKFEKQVGQCSDDAVVELMTPDARFQLVLRDPPKPAS